ncbi:DUF3846 domain-containing protein [Flavonifractor sp. An82]|uniref:DUF3846 domain-containing protein n=1 Tax=Flavonifractor sp. An82 TaxID=1965660 RepID=UPI00194FDCFD|nr:DUF3846 domain-containing protein [Flavonifractor sp. An82]
MNVLLVPPLEPPRTVELDNTLEAMQQAVGGPIQAVYPFEEPVALICHEEGKLVGLTLNRCLRLDNGEIYDIVAGTFFLCAATPDSEDFESLTAEQMEHYRRRFDRPEIYL